MANFRQIVPITGIEALEEAVKGAQNEPTQLAPGPFTGRLVFAEFDKAILSAGAFAGKVMVKGPLSTSDLTIGVILRSEGPSSQWSFETRSGDIGVIPAGEEHIARYDGQTSWVTFGLSADEILEMARHLRPDIPERFWDQSAMYRPRPAAAALIVDCFETAIFNIAERPEVFDSPSGRSALLEELLGLYLLCLEEPDPGPIRVRPTLVSASRIIRQVDDYVNDHPDRPIFLLEMCRALNVSRRSLHRAFSDVLDLPPATYLRRRRLSQVRRMLASTKDPRMTVSSAALHWGFWELGRFSGDYRRFFGELPSETLGRAIARH